MKAEAAAQSGVVAVTVRLNGAVRSVPPPLAVTEINGSVATVHYFYGAGMPPNAPGMPGSFVKTDAVMKGKYLFFKSKLGYDVTYELTNGQLMAWFSTVTLSDKLQKLQ